MTEVVIVTALRTPIGKFGGVFKDTSAIELGKILVQSAVQQLGLANDQIDEVIIGNVLGSGLGQNIARQIAIQAGLKESTSAFVVNKVCGSGLKAITLGVQSIITGENDIVIAGGTENMSQAPYLSKEQRWGQRLGHSTLVDSILSDGLTDAFDQQHMGLTAENIAAKYQISHQAQNELSLLSHQRAEAAINQGKFTSEIVPITIQQRKGTELVIDQDENPRFGMTMEQLNKLKPAFIPDGTVTAGNSSSLNDGAAIVVLMSKEKAELLGLKPLVTIKSSASAGVSPNLMGTGPIPATLKALEKANLKVEDLDLIEGNEAFASQAICVMEGLKLDPSKVNVNGGAIALGHPIGASGARILVTLIHEMEKRDAKNGLATLCIGGGQGISMIVSR